MILFPEPVMAGNGKLVIFIPGTMVTGIGNIPSRHLYILRIYPFREWESGMCGHPPLRVGRHEHAPHTGVSPPSTTAQRDKLERQSKMTVEEYREKINPCYGCGCYDADMGCTMPSGDLLYACSLHEKEEKEKTDD